MAKPHDYTDDPPDSIPPSTHAGAPQYPKRPAITPRDNPGGNQPHGRKGYGTMETVNDKARK